MNRHNFLRRLHEVSGARTYVEIGVNDGRGLALSRVPTVAVDPAPKLTSEIHCDLQLVRATSDGLFAREAPLEHLGGLIDLGFIDGMHLLEYALRDFINVERYSEWYSVIVLDDVLPRTVEEAARNRRTSAWAGDVFKMIAVLERYRPDLRLVVVDTEPTGILVVFGADPGNRILRESYDAIIAEYLVADPQPIPDAVLDRRAAIAPRHLIDAPFWPALVAAKTSSAAASYDRAQLLSDVEALIAGRAGSLAAWRPDASAPRVSEAAPAEAAAAASRPSRTLSRRLRCAARRVWSTVRARALHRRAG